MKTYTKLQHISFPFAYQIQYGKCDVVRENVGTSTMKRMHNESYTSLTEENKAKIDSSWQLTEICSHDSDFAEMYTQKHTDSFTPNTRMCRHTHKYNIKIGSNVIEWTKCWSYKEEIKSKIEIICYACQTLNLDLLSLIID